VYKEKNWENNDESVEVEKVDLITLSERNDIDIINYLKVDIEGSEYLLFKGLTGKFLSTKVEKIAIENPIGIMSTFYRKPDQIIQPFYFGDRSRKSTCLWLKNLPKLQYSKNNNLFEEKK
jgi:hypothetical protein